MKHFLSLTILNLMCMVLCGQNSFSFNDQQVSPGQKAHFLITLSDGQQQADIPITVFHGAQQGPVLGITAGVHGYEYAPILAGQQLIDKLDPETLRGTIILVQIANLASFLGRSPYLNPLDGKNLNRVFPGAADGTITARIAYYLSENVIARCDYFIDMHSGDAPEDLRPYTAFYHHDSLVAISQKGREMAIHMGFDHVVRFDATKQDYAKPEFPSLYCSAEAFKRGIPAVDVECGKLGMIEEPLIEKIVMGVKSLMKHLEMIEGEPLASAGVLLFEERFSLSSKHTGIFYPLKSSGDYVQKGMKLGYITDFFGQVVEEVYADQSGIILYMLGTPPVNVGETLFSIGALP
ncbi:MAG: M14 family metallopeptidase [Bacteroidota bacterium]